MGKNAPTPKTQWPNNPGWKALCHGAQVVVGENEPATLHVFECGELVLPSGKLMACDPFAGMYDGRVYTQVPPGSYRVAVTLANLTPDLPVADPNAHVREAYLTLVLAETIEDIRSPLPAGIDRPSANFPFPVDAGSACFVDAEALLTGMPPQDDWLAIFESDWFKRMDDTARLRPGLALIDLPLAKDGANIIISHSGWGDGHYPVVGGFDKDRNLVAVHIDFLVVGEDRSPEEVEAEADLYSKVDAIIESATEALNEGNQKEGLRLLKRAEKLCPEDLRVLEALSDYHRLQGQDIQEALRIAERAYQLYPLAIGVIHSLVSCQMEAGIDPKTILRTFEVGTRIHPDCTPLADDFAMFLQEQGDLDGAEALYRRTHARDNNADSAIALSFFLATVRGAREESFALDRLAVDLDPDHVIANANLVCALLEHDLLEEGELALQKAEDLALRAEDEPFQAVLAFYRYVSFPAFANSSLSTLKTLICAGVRTDETEYSEQIALAKRRGRTDLDFIEALVSVLEETQTEDILDAFPQWVAIE